MQHPHPWTRHGIQLPISTLAEIETHAVEAYGAGLALGDGEFEGEEACGVVTGPVESPLLAVEVERVVNLANKMHQIDPEGYPRTGRSYFWIDPLRFSRRIASGETSGKPVKILYHSHLDCGAYFSETDAATALGGGAEPVYPVAFLVVSVRGDGRGHGAHVDDRKLFLWDVQSQVFVEGALEILP